MVLRSERHRQILLQTVKQMSYIGDLAEDIVELKAEIMTATIEQAAPPNGNGDGNAAPMRPGEMRESGDRTGA